MLESYSYRHKFGKTPTIKTGAESTWHRCVILGFKGTHTHTHIHTLTLTHPYIAHTNQAAADKIITNGVFFFAIHLILNHLSFIQLMNEYFTGFYKVFLVPCFPKIIINYRLILNSKAICNGIIIHIVQRFYSRTCELKKNPERRREEECDKRGRGRVDRRMIERGKDKREERKNERKRGEKREKVGKGGKTVRKRRKIKEKDRRKQERNRKYSVVGTHHMHTYECIDQAHV